MDGPMERVAEILEQAAETHHVVFAKTDGVDEDWASWYADWLLDLSDLPETLGTRPVRSGLVWLLVQADREHRASGSAEPWPRFYAGRMVELLGSPGAAPSSGTGG